MSNVAGSTLAPGTTVAGYRVEALIGRGGMGAVYRASEEGLERKVALKVIAPELAQDERFRERFLRESRIAASLDHPHVVPIHKAGEEDGLLFIAMRYVEGKDLAKLLAEEGALEPRRTVEILEQVAEALDAAHEKASSIETSSPRTSSSRRPQARSILDATVSRIDPETYEVVATIGVGNQPRSIAVHGDSVWVTVGKPQAVGAQE